MTKKLVACSVLLIAVVSSVGQAAPARLDSRYGERGLTAITGLGAVLHGATAMPNGRVVAFGRTYGPGAAAYGSPIFVRFTAAGTRDKTFGDDGVVVPRVGDFDPGVAVADLSGSIVVAGVRHKHHSGMNAFETIIVKLTSRGSIDRTFGANGVVVFATDGAATIPRVALQPDGKVLVVESGPAWRIHRYDAAGTIDPTFGVNGVAEAPARAFSALYFGTMDVAPGGSIVVAGEYENVGAEPAVAPEAGAYVARLLPSGLPDPSFGESGVRTIAFSRGVTSVGALRIMPDGAVLTAGARGRYVHELIMMKLTPRGAMDAGFAGDGIAVKDLSSGRVLAMAIDAAGAVTIERTALIRGLSFLHRYAHGQFDRSFSPSGSVFPVSSFLKAGTTMLATSKGLVLVGARSTSSSSGIAAIRLLP